MKIDFFEKELTAVRQRFNQTLGKLAVCNLKTRYQVIIAIIQMGLLTKKIARTKDKSRVRDDIRMFIRIKNTLMTIFSTTEKIWQERRHYDNDNQAIKQSGQSSNVG